MVDRLGKMGIHGSSRRKRNGKQDVGSRGEWLEEGKAWRVKWAPLEVEPGVEGEEQMLGLVWWELMGVFLAKGWQLS
jgi:hypothetical protein